MHSTHPFFVFSHFALQNFNIKNALILRLIRPKQSKLWNRYFHPENIFKLWFSMCYRNVNARNLCNSVIWISKNCWENKMDAWVPPGKNVRLSTRWFYRCRTMEFFRFDTTCSPRDCLIPVYRYSHAVSRCTDVDFWKKIWENSFLRSYFLCQK